jgi:WD40 repeat protein
MHFFCLSFACQVAKLSTPAGVSSIEMSSDGSSLFAACGRDVMLFDTQSLTLIKSHTLTRSLLCTALNRDRRYTFLSCQLVFVAADSNCVEFSDLSTLNVLRCSCFATGEKDELWVRLYDFATGAEIDCQKGHHGPINSVAFAPTGNGNVYATGSVDGTIRIWETLPEAAEATDSGPAPLSL